MITRIIIHLIVRKRIKEVLFTAVLKIIFFILCSNRFNVAASLNSPIYYNMKKGEMAKSTMKKRLQGRLNLGRIHNKSLSFLAKFDQIIILFSTTNDDIFSTETIFKCQKFINLCHTNAIQIDRTAFYVLPCLSLRRTSLCRK